jgi:hypothetical protein
MGLWERSSTIPGPEIRSSSPEAHHVYTDLLTFCFDGPYQYDHLRPIFIDAQDPSRALNASQFRLLVRTLIAGLKAHHVQRGDCVLVHLGNSVRYLTIYPALHTALTEFYASFRFRRLLSP